MSFQFTSSKLFLFFFFFQFTACLVQNPVRNLHHLIRVPKTTMGNHRKTKTPSNHYQNKTHGSVKEK